MFKRRFISLKNVCLFVIAIIACGNCPGQLITTIAGNGVAGFSGDGGPSKNALLNIPVGLCLDAAGNLYIGDCQNARIRKVNKATGIISTIAGTGTPGFSGDGGPALNATLEDPFFMCVDDSRNCLYFSEYYSKHIRKIDLATGVITTIAGDGTENYVNGGLAIHSGMLPEGLALDGSGNIYFTQHNGPFFSLTTNIVSKLDIASGIVTTIAGDGRYIFSGDGGPALNCSFADPKGIVLDASGNIYIADDHNQRVRKIDKTTGIITTIAGDGLNNLSKDNVPAISSSLRNPSGLSLDNTGNLIIADQSDLKVRRVDLSTGIVTTLAGIGYYGFGPDCVPALTSIMGDFNEAVMDGTGLLYIPDQTGNRVRIVFNESPPTGIHVATSPATVCAGKPVTFMASVDYPLPGDQYHWEINGKDVGINSPTYFTDSFKTGNILNCVMARAGNGYCPGNSWSGTTTPGFTVKIPDTPAVQIQTAHNVVCNGSDVLFTAMVSGTSLPVSYQWMVNNLPAGTNRDSFNTSGLMNQDKISCKIILDPSAYCTVSAEAVSSSIQMQVNAGSEPGISIKASADSVCRNEPVTFTALAQYAGTAPTYQWLVNDHIQNESGSSFSYAGISEHDEVRCILTTHDAACDNDEGILSNTEMITLKHDPQIQFSDSVIVISPGQQAQLHAIPQGGYSSYQWLPAGALVDPLTLDPVTIPLFSDTSILFDMVAANGCKANQFIAVKVFFHLLMPNAFTPDGNGHNDIFRIPSHTSISLEEFSIYNRWGNRVFTTRDISKGWDGTYQMSPAPVGTYVYLIIGEGGGKKVSAKGSFLLIR